MDLDMSLNEMLTELRYYIEDGSMTEGGLMLEVSSEIAEIMIKENYSLDKRLRCMQDILALGKANMDSIASIDEFCLLMGSELNELFSKALKMIINKRMVNGK